MTIADIATRRRRAAFRAAHRGTKEMDWLVGRYAEARLDAMDEAALALFERLLDLPDPELQRWLLDGGEGAPAEVAPLIDSMRRHHGLAGDAT